MRAVEHVVGQSVIWDRTEPNLWEGRV
jgi:hypothetical protein